MRIPAHGRTAIAFHTRSRLDSHPIAGEAHEWRTREGTNGDRSSEEEKMLTRRAVDAAVGGCARHGREKRWGWHVGDDCVILGYPEPPVRWIGLKHKGWWWAAERPTRCVIGEVGIFGGAEEDGGLRHLPRLDDAAVIDTKSRQHLSEGFATLARRISVRDCVRRWPHDGGTIDVAAAQLDSTAAAAAVANLEAIIEECAHKDHVGLFNLVCSLRVCGRGLARKQLGANATVSVVRERVGQL